MNALVKSARGYNCANVAEHNTLLINSKTPPQPLHCLKPTTHTDLFAEINMRDPEHWKLE